MDNQVYQSPVFKRLSKDVWGKKASLCSVLMLRFAWSLKLRQHWAIPHTCSDASYKTPRVEPILCVWPRFQIRLWPCLLCSVSHLISHREFSIVRPLVRGIVASKWGRLFLCKSSYICLWTVLRKKSTHLHFFGPSTGEALLLRAKPRWFNNLYILLFCLLAIYVPSSTVGQTFAH